MTRSNAREIAVQMIFSLGFGNLSADEVLDTQLTQERFQELAEDMPLYSQFPNEKQAQYIRDLVRGGLCPWSGAGRLHQPLCRGLVLFPYPPYGGSYYAYRYV